jgi:serine/threonine-protein kinase HipA
MAHPEEVIREQLQALERVLARSTELAEQAPRVVAAIRQCAGPFMQTFG